MQLYSTLSAIEDIKFTAKEKDVPLSSVYMMESEPLIALWYGDTVESWGSGHILSSDLNPKNR